MQGKGGGRGRGGGRLGLPWLPPWTLPSPTPRLHDEPLWCRSAHPPPFTFQRAVLELEYKHANASGSGVLTAEEWGMYLVAFAPEPLHSDLVKRANVLKEAMPGGTVPLQDFFLFTELVQRIDQLAVRMYDVCCMDVCMCLCVCVKMRMCGCVDMWMCGCVDVWVCWWGGGGAVSRGEGAMLLGGCLLCSV